MPDAGGLVAAGHPSTAAAGAAALHAGGTAVDAALAGVLASWACEPLLTGPAAGGHLLVAGVPGTDGRPQDPVALDAFCAAPGAGLSAGHRAADPVEVDVDFGGARQAFHVGAATVGAFGLAAGLLDAHRRWGRLPLADLAAPAVALAREGARLNAQQAFVARILAGILLSTAGSRALWAPDGRLLGEGEHYVSPGLAETMERLVADGAGPLRDGDLAAACVAATDAGGGRLTARDLADHVPVARTPVRVAYRDRTVLSTPPPSAGGLLLGLALRRLDARDATDGGPSAGELVDAMGAAEAHRDDDFHDGLLTPDYATRTLGSTTHLSVIDRDGAACAVTCTNGEGSGIVVPGTGIHLNNVMGEADLAPLGPGAYPPGRRLPSMMAPTAVLAPDGTVEAVLGSAGSERIRSAILQVLVGLVDRGLGAAAAVQAPRLHVERGTVRAEPDVDLAAASATGLPVEPFDRQNLYFGGVQVVRRDPADGSLDAAGDPRRGGAVAAPAAWPGP